MASTTTPEPPRRIAYRIKEFAEFTGIPYRTVAAEYVRRGKIPSVEFGSIRVIPASYVEARLKSVRGS